MHTFLLAQIISSERAAVVRRTRCSNSRGHYGFVMPGRHYRRTLSGFNVEKILHHFLIISAKEKLARHKIDLCILKFNVLVLRKLYFKSSDYIVMNIMILVTFRF